MHQGKHSALLLVRPVKIQNVRIAQMPLELAKDRVTRVTFCQVVYVPVVMEKLKAVNKLLLA